MRSSRPQKTAEADTGSRRNVVSIVDAAPTEFALYVRKVQTDLIDSVRRAGLTRDPYSRIVEAQAAGIGVLPEFVQAVKTNRSPFSEQERQAVERTLTTHAAASINRMTWWLTARNLTLAVSVVTIVVMISTAAGYWLGYRVGADQAVRVQAGLDLPLKGREAGQWLDLMRMNRDSALRTCKPVTQSFDGETCTVTLWTKLPSVSGGN